MLKRIMPGLTYIFTGKSPAMPEEAKEAIKKYLASYNKVFIRPCDKSSREAAKKTPCYGPEGTDIIFMAKHKFQEAIKNYL